MKIEKNNTVLDDKPNKGALGYQNMFFFSINTVVMILVGVLLCKVSEIYHIYSTFY